MSGTQFQGGVADGAGVVYPGEEEAQEEKVVSGPRLYLMISKNFSNLADSVIL